MNNTITNVTLLALGTGAIGTGVDRVFAHDYIAGGAGVAIGIVLFLLYENFPSGNTPI